MAYQKIFSRQLSTNYDVLLQQLDGLTHADTLLQPPFRGNSFNWVLGHIMAHRNYMLVTMGSEPLWTDTEISLYKAGSEPITGPDCPHLPLERLLADLHTTQTQLLAKFASLSEAELTAPHNERLTVQEWVVHLSWHEGYHTGQTEYLRQLAGKDDHIT
jgi:hypothetical protein